MYNNNPILDSPHLGEKQKIYHERRGWEVAGWWGLVGTRDKLSI